MVLAGIRVVWQVALVFAAGDVVLAFAPANCPYEEWERGGLRNRRRSDRGPDA